MVVGAPVRSLAVVPGALVTSPMLWWWRMVVFNIFLGKQEMDEVYKEKVRFSSFEYNYGMSRFNRLPLKLIRR